MAAMAGSKPFVFMHYSNPTKDSKRIENRQKVAKYAMLGRQKNPVNTTTTSATPITSANATTTAPAAAAAPAASRNKVAAIGTSMTQNLGVSSKESSWDVQSGFTADRSFSIGSNSTTSSFGSNPSHSPPPISSPDHVWSAVDPTQQVRPSNDLDSSEPAFDTSWQLHSYGTAYQANGDFYSMHNVNDYEPLQPSSHNNSQGASLELEQDASTSWRRRGKKQHERAKLMRDSGREQGERDDGPVDSTSMMVSRYSATPIFGNSRYGENGSGPRTLLSATPGDPFNALPIKANAHTHELLYQYMNARLISSVYANGSPDTFERIKKMRHTVWGPLTWKSKASLNALVAYVESTPGLPIKSRSQDFLFSHVQAAMEAVREALSKPKVATDDSICFAVVLLMLTAQRTGNTKTYAAHAAGLATLLSFRTDAIRENGKEDDTVERLRTFYITDPQERCLYCRTNQDYAGSPPRIFPTDVDSFNEAVYPRGEGFRDLIRRGLLTKAMNSFIEPAMIWSTLAERARKDKLSAAIGATHAWIDEGEFSLKGPIHFLDTACFTAVRLCFYLSSWLDWQHSCSAVDRLARAVNLSLRRADTEYLLLECPSVLLWLCLIAGPLCENEARAWFAYLLVRAKSAIGLQMWDFQSQVDTFGHLYVWSGTMTPGAERFWNEICFDIDTHQAWEASTSTNELHEQ